MRKSTARQQLAVAYCENWLYIEFNGDINSFNDCSTFLSIYLEDAKRAEMELACEFEAYIWGD